MQKIINNPADVVDEMILGYLRAHPDLVLETENPRVLKSATAGEPGRVGIVGRSGTLGYEAASQMKALGIGVSTSVGIVHDIYGLLYSVLFYDV